MKVNVVMLAKNRQHLTYQCIRTLYRHTPAELFNFTIVDDESSIRPMIDFRKMEYAYLRIEKSQSITGRARNLGVYWAEKVFGRGDYLYLSDNDMYFTPGWLEKLIHSLVKWGDHLQIIGGWNHPFLHPQAINYHQNLGDTFRASTHDAVAGASQLMTWETWDKYGPLDAHAPGVGQSEDWAMCQKIIQDGGRVGSLYPRVVLNCGLKNSFGVASPGADLMLQELEAAKPMYPDLYWEGR